MGRTDRERLFLVLSVSKWSQLPDFVPVHLGHRILDTLRSSFSIISF